MAEPLRIKVNDIFGVSDYQPPRMYGRYDYFMGCPIIVDESLPLDVIEFRDAKTGEVISQVYNVEWPQEKRRTWWQRIKARLK